MVAPNPQGETLRQRLEKLRQQLINERESFIGHWRELTDYILPRRGRFMVTDRNKGDRRTDKIIDNTATLASRTLRSGMMGGITSPARPWFRLTTPDAGLAEQTNVRIWLDMVTHRLNTVFLRSNLYNALPTLYGDLGTYSTAAMIAVEDERDVVRFYVFPVGSYSLANSQRQRVDTIVREFSMTVRQVVEEFGTYNDDGTLKPDNLSEATRTQWESGNTENWVEVVHVIKPNPDHNPDRLEARFKPYLSIYYEAGGDSETMLRESGFDEFPVMAPRWEVTDGDVYGSSGPGMDCLGDVKMLQTMQRRSLQGIDKQVNPPMVAPESMANHPASLLPGHITYVNAREGMQGFQPAYQVDLRLQDLEYKIEKTQHRISRSFFEDLFLMLAQDQRTQPATAREVIERHEEKMIMLGPVLERLNDELLDPLIDRVFNIMERRGMIPEPPEELAGMELKVEYVSIMAQAQKMVATGAIERFSGFVGNLMSVNPAVGDKYDMDQAVDEYGEMTGVSPRIVRSDEDVAAIRQQRAERQAQQQQAEALQGAAQGAKTLSETDLQRDSALKRVLGM